MTKSSNANHTKRFVTDALAGLGVFVLITTMVAGSGSFAATLTLVENENMNYSMANAAGNEHSIVVLGIVFSVLFALNAAFFRHLGRAYTGASRRK
ncbi:MAG: hypothetical protein ABL894_04750 [Hyphomicrobium sp.]